MNNNNTDTHTLRNILKGCVNKFTKTKHKISHIDRVLQNKIRATNEFIEVNPSILLTKACKGKVTLAIEREVHTDKVMHGLSEDKYYEQLPKNLLNSLEKSVDNITQKWLKLGIHKLDSSFDILQRKINNTNLARAYGLIKIHKKDLPARIIVSTGNSLTYFLDKAICPFFNKYLLMRTGTSCTSAAFIANVVLAVTNNKNNKT